MKAPILLLLLTIGALAYLALSQDSRDTCGHCTSSHSDLAWCQQEDFTQDSNRQRCDTKANLIKQGCNQDQVVRPEASMEIIDDLPLSSTTGLDDGVQLRPQRIKLRLPPHVPKRITLQFKQAEDYPVDLYYLMDLSNSMMDDKKKLVELGKKLADNFAQNLTKNFMLGFGSFVDKKTMPYVSTVPEKLINPCKKDFCEAPYGFKNHMPLNSDTSNFTHQVNASQISGNLDAPEGGLDAIMQSIVCRDAINWREKSRKMLVYTTDASFHYAGDGKLAGIVVPNDGECHLDSQGYYSMSLEQDYPSISQINRKAQEHRVNIIFAATANQVDIYQKLTDLIEGSLAGRLESDSSNVVQLIEQSYRDIISDIELKDNRTSNVQLTYQSACLGDKYSETKICKGLKLGSTVSFDIDVEVTSCPKSASEYNQTIRIYPVGLNESLLIDLEILCDCDCEKPWNVELLSPRCNGAGTYVCGACVCDPFRYGKNCQCSVKDSSDTVKDLLSCLRGNDTRPCSSRGSCVCGKCHCFTRKNEPDFKIYGEFCECDNFNCFHHENKICSGPDHGYCDCGTCKCLPGWSGPACACSTNNSTCMHKESGKICAGHGECVCGKCRCHSTEDRQYTGDFCESCPTCPTMCEQYKDCVRCTTHHSGPLTEEQCQACRNDTFSITNVTEFTVEKDETYCVFRDDDDCTYQFAYRLTPIDHKGDNTTIRSDVHKECPVPIPIFLILLALALLILLLGLLGLLLWKCLTMWSDRREFAQLEKDSAKANWPTGENPLHNPATSTYRNPLWKEEPKKV